MPRKSKKTFVIDTPKPSKKVRISESSNPSKSSSRQHVTCDCNICKGRKVDPRTKDSHTKERELPVRNEPSNMVAGEGTNQINFLNDPMDLDETNISGDNDDDDDDDNDDSRIEKMFNFLVTRLNKPKRQKQSSSRGGNRKINYPFVLIEQILNSDEEQNTDESEINEDSDDELDGEVNSEQHVDFDAPEFDKNEGAELPIPDINTGFT